MRCNHHVDQLLGHGYRLWAALELHIACGRSCATQIHTTCATHANRGVGGRPHPPGTAVPIPVATDSCSSPSEGRIAQGYPLQLTVRPRCLPANRAAGLWNTGYRASASGWALSTYPGRRQSPFAFESAHPTEPALTHAVQAGKIGAHSNVPQLPLMRAMLWHSRRHLGTPCLYACLDDTE